jgi:aldose 1-epimerase
MLKVKMINTMKTNKTVFHNFEDEDIYLFELENDKGIIVKVMNLGATITSITVPNDKGRSELVCGFDKFKSYFSEQYLANAPYFGSTIGRYSSLIKESEFYIKGKEFLLAANSGDNNLHGGVIGFDKMIWTADLFEEKDAVGVNFSLESTHGEEGFPGDLKVHAKMTLNNDNEIKIDYKATTTRTTPISLSNHSYFNLSGFERTIEDHIVKVSADKCLELDETGAATGVLLDVSKSQNDLRKGRIVKDVHAALGDGLESFYVFDNPDFQLNKVAEISDPESGRSLEVFSKEPCMFFYTGKSTSDDLTRESGGQFGKFRGFVCGTHRYPNGPNIENSPGTFTSPDKPFETSTIYKLSW